MKVLNTTDKNIDPLFPKGIAYAPLDRVYQHTKTILLTELPYHPNPDVPNKSKALEVLGDVEEFDRRAKHWIWLDEGVQLSIPILDGKGHEDSIFEYLLRTTPEKWRNGTWMIKRTCCGRDTYVEGPGVFGNSGLIFKLYCHECLTPAIKLHRRGSFT